VLEAMKTEQTLRAPYAGVVRALTCREGEVVQEGTLLVEIE
jgi:3-methylcrotonyl-CoA carboxylase alpha subunit